MTKKGIITIDDHTFVLKDGLNFVGRDPSLCSIVLSKGSISKSHALIIKLGDKYYISDLRSTNGVQINEQGLIPHACCLITENSKILIGDISAKFSFEDQDPVFKIPQRLQMRKNATNTSQSINEVETQDLELSRTQVLGKTQNVHEMETQLLEEIDIPNTQKTNETRTPQATASIHELETQYLDDLDEIPATQKTNRKETVQRNIHELNTQLIEEKVQQNIHEVDTQLIAEKVEGNINELDTQLIEESFIPSTENFNGVEILETQFEVEEEPENLLTKIHEIETQLDVEENHVKLLNNSIMIPETQFETSGVKSISFNNYSNLIIDSSLDVSDSQMLQVDCEPIKSNKSSGEPVDSILEIDETQYNGFVAEPDISTPINDKPKIEDHNFDNSAAVFDDDLDDSDFINTSTDIEQESKIPLKVNSIYSVTGTNNNTIKNITGNEQSCPEQTPQLEKTTYNACQTETDVKPLQAQSSVFNTTTKESILKNIPDDSTATPVTFNALVSKPSESVLSCQQTPIKSNSILSKTPMAKPADNNLELKSPAHVGGSTHPPHPMDFDDITPIKSEQHNKEEEDIFEQATQISAINSIYNDSNPPESIDNDNTFMEPTQKLSCFSTPIKPHLNDLQIAFNQNNLKTTNIGTSAKISTIENVDQENLFDAATQIVDMEATQKIPTFNTPMRTTNLNIGKKNLSSVDNLEMNVDNNLEDLFYAATQKIPHKPYPETNPDNNLDIFEAATQKVAIHKAGTSSNENVVDIPTQKISICHIKAEPKTPRQSLNVSTKMSDTFLNDTVIFDMNTQKVDTFKFAAPKLPDTIVEDDIFEVATQVIPTLDKLEPTKNNLEEIIRDPDLENNLNEDSNQEVRKSKRERKKTKKVEEYKSNKKQKAGSKKEEKNLNMKDSLNEWVNNEKVDAPSKRRVNSKRGKTENETNRKRLKAKEGTTEIMRLHDDINQPSTSRQEHIRPSDDLTTKVDKHTSTIVKMKENIQVDRGTDPTSEESLSISKSKVGKKKSASNTKKPSGISKTTSERAMEEENIQEENPRPNRRAVRKRAGVDLSTNEEVSPPKEIKIEQNSSTSSTESSKLLRKKYNVLFTLFRDEAQENVVKRLGGRVVEKTIEANVLVTMEIRRSVKLLSAISRGIPVVSSKWLEVCRREQKFVDPWDHLLLDEKAEKKFQFNLNESLNTAKTGLLLDGYTVVVTKSVPSDMKDIIENSGGKYLQEIPDEGVPEKGFVVSTIDDKKDWPRRRHKIPIIVSAEAIYSSVIRQRLDLKSHMFP